MENYENFVINLNEQNRGYMEVDKPTCDVRLPDEERLIAELKESNARIDEWSKIPDFISISREQAKMRRRRMELGYMPIP